LFTYNKIAKSKRRI
jgi:hypothetical protein